ncbi:MAG: hypothetical protein H0U02_02805, partial [Rubrobacter sp.]|nr:hypothetical protein [Rubrobacter sp.]
MSFILLTSSVGTSELRVRGTIARNFRGAYDILVRPSDSFTPLEKQRGLVRENYLSGIVGGITLRDYRRIRRTPGVAVAAPIANIGYIAPFQVLHVRINRFLSRDPHQIYRLNFNFSANAGLSRYPATPQFVYYTTRHRLVQKNSRVKEVLDDGRKLRVCDGFYDSVAKRSVDVSPFARKA